MLKFKQIIFLTIACVFPVAQAFCASMPVRALEPGDIVMQIQPAEQEIELIPGERYVATVKIQNVGRLPFKIRLLAKPYQAIGERYDPDFTTENSYTNLHNWITFPNTEYQLEPGMTLEAPFVIKVPADVPGGGQYAAIIVETRDSIDKDATIKIVSQLASLVYAHVQGDEHIGGVLMSHSLPGFLVGNSFSSNMIIKNDGNVDFRATQTLTVHDFFTNREVFGPDTLDDKDQSLGRATPAILPATSRSNQLTWPGAPQIGVFRATQTISFLDENYTFTSIVIICPIWLVALILFFIFWMVLWLVLRVRNRKKQKKQQLTV